MQVVESSTLRPGARLTTSLEALRRYSKISFPVVHTGVLSVTVVNEPTLPTGLSGRLGGLARRGTGFFAYVKDAVQAVSSYIFLWRCLRADLSEFQGFWYLALSLASLLSSAMSRED